MQNAKFVDEPVTQALLNSRTNPNYPKAKWIEFCELMLGMGFELTIYEARQTVSKYITLFRDGMTFKVRFSNHPPARRRMETSDCDFFVGKTHRFTTNTSQAIDAVRRFFRID